MACVVGEDLEERIAKGPLPLVDAATIALQLANALHEAHSKGVVHRDIKPSNVVISEKGHAILMDFGLAKLHGQTRITQEGTTLGTVAYMSPEQSKGTDVDSRSDIWSLGVILHEMVIGRQPFAGDHQSAVIYAITNAPAPPLTSLRSDVPMELERIVTKMLAKDPDERYQSIDDVRVDLKAMRKSLRGESDPNVTGVVGTTTPPGGVVGETSSGTLIVKAKRPVWVVPVLVIAAVAVVVAFFLTLRGGDDGAETASSTQTAPSQGLENSLAVLPLRNISGEEQNEFFVDGMTEELITQLAGIRALKVISRTSVMRYKNTEKPLTEIAHELGVGKILEGSVLWAGDRVRITAQLIDGTNDAHLWANSYESDLDDVLGLQRRVARAVADEIKLELTPEEAAELAETPVVDRRAHELYLLGRHQWTRRSVELIYKAIEHYEAAIALDPTYAMAYAGLAEAHIVLTAWDVTRPAAESYENARVVALKAIELDPTLAGANAVLAGVAGEYDRDFAEAERRFLKTLELNPNYASAHQWYAELLVALARYDDAVREIGIAIELDPAAPVVYAVGAWIYSLAGDRQRTLECLERVSEIDPGFAGMHNTMAGAYHRFGEDTRAMEAWTTWEEMTAATDRGRDNARRLRETIPQGRDAFWRLVVEQHKRIYEESHYIAAEIAAEFAILGEADSAIVWLEKGSEERTVTDLRLAADARFDPIRNDKRFREIVRRLGLEQANERYMRQRAQESF
jgi:TolB-like protein